jgi:Carboxypeptidase regulatory-like domain
MGGANAVRIERDQEMSPGSETIVRPRAARAVLLFACLAIFVTARFAAGQTLATGVLAGTVVDADRIPVSAVIVTITSHDNGQHIFTRTDRSGAFETATLSPGHYSALFERLGYEPLLVEDVLIAAGSRRNLRVSINAAEGIAGQRRVSPAEAANTISGQSGPDRWILSHDVTATLPLDANGIGAVARISSLADDRGDIEGLAAARSTISIDGFPLARRVNDLDSFILREALPLAYLSQVSVSTTTSDAEQGPSVGGFLNGFTRRGGSRQGLRAFGDFSNNTLVSGSADASTFSSWRAGGIANGAIIRDTASFIVGGEVQRGYSPYESPWTGSAATGLGQVADGKYGADLSGFTEPTLSRFDRETGFGRFDFQISDGTTASVRGLIAQAKQPQPIAPWTGSPVGSTITPKFREIFLGANLVTRVDDQLTTEINIGFESSASERVSAAARGPAYPLTTVAGDGFTFGSAQGPEFRNTLTSFYLRGTLHIQSGSHWRKFGIEASLPSYRFPLTRGRGGEFTFANAADYGIGFGAYRGIEGDATVAKFNLRRVSIVAEDLWRPREGLELMIGARLSSERMPDSSAVTHATRWEELTGLANADFPGRMIDVEPRFTISITPAGRQDWRVNAGLSVDADIADPALIGEIVANWGGQLVRSGFGDLRGWPDAPQNLPVELRSPTLSVIGPKFRGPRSTRIFGGISRVFGTSGAFTINGTFRRTDFLPQRVDLNRPPSITGYDQFDRPLYGTLEKRAGLLVAKTGSNRRFGDYEEVWGLQSAGRSDFTGLTVTLERPLVGPLSFFGSYTFSRTEDDVLSGNPSNPFTQLAPFSDTLVSEPWEKGRSDFDIPHRVVAGAELKAPGSFSPTFAALFRYQSGYPFTPGFRPGVDANGDGSGYNDPAYIDDGVSGMGTLLQDWPCLQQDKGQFSRRNACRGSAIMSLDARFSLSLRKAAGYSASIVLDGLNLLQSDAGIVDSAVYLVDPNANLAISPDGTRTTVPLIANPDFGQLLTRFRPQRQLRLGARVSF